MKSFSHRFISNPRLAWVIAIVISLCGGLCLSRMPVSEYPNIIPVTITVKAMYTGATAEVVNESVCMVLEDQINAVDDVWYFKSTSNAKGNYSCNVMFRPGVNPDIALVNVQNAVKRAEKKLPAEVVKSGIVVKKSPEDRMALYMFTTDGRKMDIMALSNFVEKQVADAVARLRFRAVQMTAWGFIFGVLPLVFAKGAGSGSLRAIGICTCAGMLASTFVGIVFVPALYSIVERVREALTGRRGPKCGQ